MNRQENVPHLCIIYVQTTSYIILLPLMNLHIPHAEVTVAPGPLSFRQRNDVGIWSVTTTTGHFYLSTSLPHKLPIIWVLGEVLWQYPVRQIYLCLLIHTIRIALSTNSEHDVTYVHVYRCVRVWEFVTVDSKYSVRCFDYWWNFCL